MTAPRVHSRMDMPFTPTRNARAIAVLFLLGWVGLLRERARIRRDMQKLARADDHILRDLGLNRADIQRLSGRFRD